MRGIVTTFSRLPRLTAWVAGAAILAGMVSSPALAQTDEVAMAVPRLSARGLTDGDGAALPQPLGPAARATFSHYFALARHAPCGKLPTLADVPDLPAGLSQGLIGHVLAQYYTRCGTTVPVADLRAWLTSHAALPGADAILALLRRRAPRQPLPAHLARIAEITIQSVPSTEPDPSLGPIPPRARHLAEDAQAKFTSNHDEAARNLALRAARLAPGYGFAHLIAGLAAWRLGRADQALRQFAATATARHADAATQAAGAYWAARASLAAGDHTHWQGWLRMAASHRRSFYGLIALRMLGWSDGLDFSPGLLGEADGEALAATEGGLRALALLQLDESNLAAAELHRLAVSQPKLTRSIMLVAERAGLFNLAATLADTLDASGNYASAADLYPVPALRPAQGFLLDPALVYAVARVESNFDPRATSREGAHGLMQLMPLTAKVVGWHGANLDNEADNLAIGQRYLDLLATQPAVQGNLLRVLASYNAGPSSCAAWCDKVRDFNDPLLFIEAIPVDETRNFVKRVLTATWIYADRLHLASPSLDALVAGHFPRYSSPDHANIQQVALH